MKSSARMIALSLVLVVCGSVASAYQVYGEIAKKWRKLGGAAGFLGQPVTDETGTPDGVGRFNHFEHGSIYWHPRTGAYEVHGQIRDKWASMGWERSWVGYPIEDEVALPDKRGHASCFEHGWIAWSPTTGAHVMRGTTGGKWADHRVVLGYPTIDETPTPDGRGRFIHFETGSIYWSPESGMHEVHGAIRDKWAALRWERGSLGYPTSDEFQDGAYRRSNFQHGHIRWSPQTGAVAALPID